LHLPEKRARIKPWERRKAVKELTEKGKSQSAKKAAEQAGLKDYSAVAYASVVLEYFAEVGRRGDGATSQHNTVDDHPMVGREQFTNDYKHMSKKLASFIERYPNMFAEYRAFAVKAIRDNDRRVAEMKAKKS
jgi:hypothetical protein